jgi:hypothetical protein
MLEGNRWRGDAGSRGRACRQTRVGRRFKRRGIFRFEPLEPRRLLAVAEAGGPYLVDEGASIMLTGSATGSAIGALTFDWDLDNNGTFETAGQNVTFSAVGLDGPTSKVVTLRLNDGGVISTETVTVNVANAPPNASISTSEPRLEGNPITVTATASDPAGASDTVSLGWKIFEDGTLIGLRPNLESFDFVFADDGSYQIQLTAEDEDFGQRIVNQTVVVENVAPTIVSLNVPSTADIGASIQVSAVATDPADTLNTAQSLFSSFQWHIDGPDDFELNRSGNPAGSFPTPAAGVYTVTLTVNDGDGGSDTESAEIRVGIINSPPLADAGGPYRLVDSNTIALDASASSDADQTSSSLNYEWYLA